VDVDIDELLRELDREHDGSMGYDISRIGSAMNQSGQEESECSHLDSDAGWHWEFPFPSENQSIPELLEPPDFTGKVSLEDRAVEMIYQAVPAFVLIAAAVIVYGPLVFFLYLIVKACLS
jgi:hypothetical protein